MTTETEGAASTPPRSEDLSNLHEAIRKEIRSWSFTLLILGALHIFAAGFLSGPWGGLLIVVGLASFYFRSSAMLVVYAVTIAWAGVSNLASGQWTWIVFAIIQWYFSFRILRRFSGFRRAEQVLGTPSDVNASGLTPQRSAKVFPWAGFLLGVFSFLAFAGAFLWAIVYAIISESETPPGFLSLVEGLAVSTGVLGFALGLASVLCGYRFRILAILGMVAGLLTLAIEIALGLIF